MMSNAQGTSAANGHSTTNGACLVPEDVRDALTPGLFRFMMPVQMRQ